MREVTSDYISQVKSGARQFGFYVNIYGNGPEPETLWLSDIISVEITRSASDQLQIGACMSDRLTLRTKATTLFNGRGKKVVVYYRCTAPILGWIRLGTFYVEECVTDRGVTAVTAYDMMSRLDKRISWGATSRTEALIFPCSMQDMLEYICARAGVTTDFVCQNITIEKPPDGYTARELISYIAASHGANARFSPSEVLRIRSYTQTTEIIQYGGCYSMDIASDGGFTVKGILFDRGGGDTIYIDGTASEYDEDADGVVEAYNPFATVGIAEYAWGVLGGLSYSAVSLEMPAQNILEPGDVFTVRGADGTEKTAIVMEQTLSVSCTGGFVETISCTAESKNQTRNAENRAAAAEKEIQRSAGSALTEYEYLTDLSVKYNGIVYAAEKDAETGLIARISDSAGNEFKPKINSGITDVGLHNAVFWAVAMHGGLLRVPDIMLFTGDGGEWHFQNGLSGFKEVKMPEQTYSGIDGRILTSGIRICGIHKDYGKENQLDGWTNAAVIHSNDKIDLTKYRKMVINGIAHKNYGGITGSVFFRTGMPTAPQSNSDYDFSDWTKICDCDITTNNYFDPGAMVEYTIDISRIAGSHYINFGLRHGSESLVYSVYWCMSQITLIP